jgi:uncharacterized membrane protein YqjE
MNTNGRHDSKLPNVAASVSDLAHDVIELSELQIQLLTLDLKESTEKARTCLILAVVAGCILLGTIPVALFALAEWLVWQFEWARAGAFAIATVVGLATAAGIGAWAYAYVKKGLLSIERSRNELQRNISWLKSTLRTRGQHRPAERPINY